MARKSGSAYPVDDDWRKRVEETLTEKTWTRADLGRESGVSKSTITELLNGDTNECVGLPDIHRALGWLPPYATLSTVEEMLLRAFRRLEPFGQGELIERARSLVERQNARQTPAPTTKKQARVLARAGVVGHRSRPLREADELPIEAAARKRH